MSDKAANELAKTLDEPRSWLGHLVVGLGLAFIGLLAAVAIHATKGLTPDGRVTAAKDILSMVLPLFGAWIGTVLAFYFSKENFAAAAQQTAGLVRQLTPEQRLQGIDATAVMIPMETASKLVLQADESKVNLMKDILAGPLAPGKPNRLPIVEASGRVKYVLHRSMFDRFISERVVAGAQNVPDLTLQDMLADDAYEKIALAFGSLSRGAKLNAAKAQMDGSPDCSDVFVTEDGTKASKAIGWITNVIVAEKSKL